MRHPMQEAQKVPWLLFPLLQAEIYCWQVWGIHRKKKSKIDFRYFFLTLPPDTKASPNKNPLWMTWNLCLLFLRLTVLLISVAALLYQVQSWSFPHHLTFTQALHLRPLSLLAGLYSAPGWTQPNRICSTKSKRNRLWIILVLSWITSPCNKSSVAVNSRPTAHRSWTTACRNQYHWL